MSASLSREPRWLCVLLSLLLIVGQMRSPQPYPSSVSSLSPFQRRSSSKCTSSSSDSTSSSSDSTSPGASRSNLTPRRWATFRRFSARNRADPKQTAQRNPRDAPLKRQLAPPQSGGLHAAGPPAASAGVRGYAVVRRGQHGIDDEQSQQLEQMFQSMPPNQVSNALLQAEIIEQQHNNRTSREATSAISSTDRLEVTPSSFKKNLKCFAGCCT